MAGEGRWVLVDVFQTKMPAAETDCGHALARTPQEPVIHLGVARSCSLREFARTAWPPRSACRESAGGLVLSWQVSLAIQKQVACLAIGLNSAAICRP